MAAASFASNRQSLLVARDELELLQTGPTAGPSAAAFSSASSPSNGCGTSSFSSSSNGQCQNGRPSANAVPVDGGPLSTLRRSLRQMNPFKSRLFRLPATPRLTRSKKVLARGEGFTGWNFERPGNGDESSACNSLRPLSSSSFGPVDFEYRSGEDGGAFENGFVPAHYQRRFSQANNGTAAGQFQPSPMLQRRVPMLPQMHGSCACCAQNAERAGNGGGVDGLEGLDDLDQFLDAMENISRRGQIGGSCRAAMPSGHGIAASPLNGPCPRVVGTVCGPPQPVALALGVPGTRRTRMPIPSFNAPPPSNGWHSSPPMVPNGRNCAPPVPMPRQGQGLGHNYLQLLPSTCYSPNGDVYSARWHPGQSLAQSPLGGSPRLAQRATAAGKQRPQPLYLPGELGTSGIVQEPKSPSHSSITLLNGTQVPGMPGMRSGSTVSSASMAIRQKQILPQRLANTTTTTTALFPQTQLQRRRSACSASAPGTALEPRCSRDRSIAEEEGEEEEEANYYGRDLLKLMGQKMEENAAHSPGESPSLLLCPPPLLFPLEEEMMANADADEPFVGREWLFKELCHQLVTERAQLVLIMASSGYGKSAVLRQLLANSHFCAAKATDQQQQQHNTVDSGIAISGNSSGSQLSLLNISSHHFVPAEPNCSSLCPPQNVRCSSPSPSSTGRNYEWLRTLGKHICAAHFAHLYNGKSCAIAEFVRSICAQLCQCPQLRSSYGMIIRSNPTLHRLAIDESASLALEPMALFRQLILQPIGQIYEEEEQRKKERRPARRSSSGKAIDFDCSDPSLPPFIVVLVDALDEAGFHRTDGGESIGWLLRRALAQCPPQLRFLATLIPGPGPISEQSAIFGTLSDGEKPVEARSIRLDDWEVDERVARDARLYVEMRVQQSPALEKWLNAQFRRQSFFASSSSCQTDQLAQQFSFQLAQQKQLSDFAAQLVQRCRANFTGLQLALGLLAEGRVLSLGSLPAELGQLYALHFGHKFPCAAQFGTSSAILSVLLASLRPLHFDELLTILNSSTAGDEPQLGADELNQQLAQLWPLVGHLPVSGQLIPSHPSLREWLLKEGGGTEFAVDIRHGHILLALSLIASARMHPPNHAQLFELAHHLLKANPHKYLRQDMAQRLGMPQGKDAQVQWLRMAGDGERAMANALLWPRNVFYPNSKVSRLLLLAGANPNASRWPDGREQPLLSAFARAGNAEMVQLLLQFGANPNLGTPSPLLLATQHGHEAIVRLLCANGADLSAKDGEGRGLLWHAAANDSLALLGFLLDTIGEAEGKPAGSNKLAELAGNVGGNVVHQQQRYSSVSSSSAAMFEEEKAANLALALPTNGGGIGHWLDVREAVREAFECAAERGSARVCRFLMDSTDTVLDTSRAMCIACANGRSDVVQFLLSRGATLAPEQTWNGKSALVCAVESGSWDLVVNLLNGAGPNALGQLNAFGGLDRLSPLMVAARHGHVGLVDLLVNRGANLDTADAHGRTAAMHGIEAGHSSAVGLLLEKGCSPHVRDGHANTMLHLLARHPSKCLINRLLEAGLSLEDKNREDLRPIEVAIQCGQLLAVDAFLRRGARLRSLTWQIAIASHPPLLLVLLRKLLDDAQILLRRKRVAEAQHRFSYALQKCDEILAKCQGTNGGGVVQQQQQQAQALANILAQLRRYRVQALHSMAALKRRSNDIPEAICLATEALDTLNGEGAGESGDSSACSPSSPSCSSGEEAEECPGMARDQQRFELHLLRAKYHFDARDLAKARVDAQLAACLRPGDQEAQSLVAVLSMA